MLSFKDIFAIQIVGVLTSRKFSGDCNLLVDKLSAQASIRRGLFGRRAPWSFGEK
jgi:hypothetical protein